MDYNGIEYRGYFLSYSKKSPQSIYISVVGKGGKIPNLLDGFFTSYGIAKQAVDAYLSSKEQKNAKEVD